MLPAAAFGREPLGDPILDSTDTALLAGSAMRNLEALFGAMCELEGSVLERRSNLSRHLTFPTNPMFKGAWSSRLTEDDAGAVIDDTIAWFRARGAPYFFWWTDEDARPADLGQRLEAHGLLSMEAAQAEFTKGIVQTAAGAPVMVLDLARADPRVVQAAPADFRIAEVASERELADFKQVFVATYQIPDWAGAAWVDATRTFGIGRSPWRVFVGYLGAEPVAVSMLFCGGGVASSYAVATLPSAQRRGIGGAITLLPLLLARDLGYRHAALFSTEPGYPVYRRLGFEDTGRRLNRYLWRAP